MYAKFRLLLTLLVFAYIDALRPSESYAKETNSNTKKITPPIEIAKKGTEIEARTTLADETTTMLSLSEEEEVLISGEEELMNDDEATSDELLSKGRSFAGNENDAPRPLKNMLRGIYKSYKSTYMGNGTSAEYKKRLLERLNAAASTKHTTSTTSNSATKPQSEEVNKTNERLKKQTSLTETEVAAAPLSALSPTHESEALKVKLIEKQRKRKRKISRAHSNANKRAKVNNHLNVVADSVNENNNNNNSSYSSHINSTSAVSSSGSASGGGIRIHTDINELHDKHYRYSIGPGVNMSFDMLNDIVNVNLDGDNLRDIMRGRWLSDNTEEGRGKKYDMVTKVLPLFVLPFLIQSAIVPFLVTKLKLLLVKSILIGKLAIFLIIISAIKNSNNKTVQSYEVAPSYWAGEPSRRSELASAAATSAAYNGYRVEGKPAAWIN
ncbi:uncharacterized protein DDB_G0280205 [Eurosta solidaginis]|uniref:uncharacterized protein DDB_G0280205 n=1 Tax=Eurosta solidaginis TaxID=178769 RepID=UPI003530F48C